MSYAIQLDGAQANIVIKTASFSNDTGVQAFQIPSKNFIHYIRDEQYAVVGRPNVGLSLPTAELKVIADTPQRVMTLMQADAIKVTVTIAPAFNGQDAKNQLTHNYLVTNIDIDLKGSGVITTFYMVADLTSFTRDAVIKAYGSSDDPISSVKAIYEATSGYIQIATDTKAGKQVDESFDTDDKQGWIQPNIPTFQFVANVIRHSNISGGDLLMGAINNDKLKLVSYNECIARDKSNADAYIYAITPSEPINPSGANLAASSVTLESSMGVYSYLLGVKSVPQVKILANKTNTREDANELTKPTGAKDPQDFFTTTRVIAPRFDCGNTHEKYWDAQLANEKKLSRIYRHIAYVTIDGLLLDGSVNLLDTVYVDLRGVDTDQKTDSAVLQGNFVVLGISRYLSQKSASNRIALGRDSHS